MSRSAYYRRPPSIMDKKLKHRVLSKEEEIELVKRLQESAPNSARARAANDTLVLHNLKLVQHLCAKHARFMVRSSAQLDDVFQDGAIGLMHGISKFDLTKKTRLSTYVSWWIRACSVRAALGQQEDVALKGNVLNRYLRLRRMSSEFAASNGRPPTDDELSKESKVSLKGIASMRKAVAQGMLYLDVEIDGHSGGDLRTHKDMLPDPKSLGDQEEEYRPKQLRKLPVALDFLDERERFVVENYFGIGGRQERKLKWCGDMLGVGRERARQLKERAMRKIHQAIKFE